ncbi:MAG: DUF523 domain-containing protein [Clostridia bacterium]|nr:DUF523 domain-containing protein [Clostridia bacterium]
MRMLISACLLGENCKYSGGNNRNERVLRYAEGHEVIAVCPEVEGGLPCPRKPVEWVGDRVLTRDGDDCTDAFSLGVRRVIERMSGERIDLAILQSRSPSCGVKEIYDGSFTGVRIPGQGLLARTLAQMGVPLMDAEDVPD